MKQAITTSQAPTAIGTYSQAISIGQTLYVSGQIPLDPDSMEMVGDDIRGQINQVLDNLTAILEAAGSGIDNVLKFTVFLTDLDHFPRVNEIMAERLSEPYPARVVIEVSDLPKGAKVEIDAIATLT